MSDYISPERVHDLIKYYFERNCTYNDIVQLLEKKHNIIISLSTLKRTLVDLGLCRRNFKESDIEEIVHAIVEELHGPGYNLGYRNLHDKLKSVWDLKIKRDTVYRIQSIADPEGVADRRAQRLRKRQFHSRGPNYIWSFDGYDKVKAGGFAIHGCMDAYSRKMLWLEVATTNKDPRVIAYYYLKYVIKKGCVPMKARTDKGTENTRAGSLQVCLRMRHGDAMAGPRSYVAGKSTKNQRIEAFWGQLRKHSMDYYIQLIRCMEESGLFDGSDMHIKCLQFCFGPLIQKDLKETQMLWNRHHIRKQSSKNVIHGRPFTMYNLPEKYGAKDYGKPVDVDVAKRLLKKYTKEPQLYDPLFAQVAHTLIPNLKTPSSREEALDLYKNLLHLINAEVSDDE